MFFLLNFTHVSHDFLKILFRKILFKKIPEKLKVKKDEHFSGVAFPMQPNVGRLLVPTG